MPDERFEEQLRRELERPALSAPRPAQARYRLARAAAARPRRQTWLRVGAAFAAGAVAAVIILSTSTGSTNPRVWSVKVVSTFVELRPEPASTPTATPTTAPSTSTPSQGTPPTKGGDGAQTPQPSQEQEKGTPEPRDSSSPSPGSEDRSGDDGSSGSGRNHDLPTPTPTAEPKD